MLSFLLCRGSEWQMEITHFMFDLGGYVEQWIASLYALCLHYKAEMQIQQLTETGCNIFQILLRYNANTVQMHHWGNTLYDYLKSWSIVYTFCLCWAISHSGILLPRKVFGWFVVFVPKKYKPFGALNSAFRCTLVTDPSCISLQHTVNNQNNLANCSCISLAYSVRWYLPMLTNLGTVLP